MFHSWECARRGFRNRIAIVAEPISRKFQAATDPLRSQRKIDCAAQLVRNEVTNRVRSKARVFGSYNRGPADLSPIEDQIRTWVTVQALMPTDRHAAGSPAAYP